LHKNLSFLPIFLGISIRQRSFASVLSPEALGCGLFLCYYSIFALALLALFAFIHRHAQKSGNTLITDITA